MSPKNDFKAELLSQLDVYNAAYKLAEEIMNSSLDFDAIVAIARGGFPPARFLCDFLNIEKLYSIQIKHYAKGAEQQKKVSVLNKSLGDIKDMKILLVDDVNDSGKSLIKAKEQLKDASLLKTAVLHEKETTEFKVDFVADYIHEWKWLIYPWAAAEDVLEFLHKGNKLDSELYEAKEYLMNEYDLQVEELILRNIMDMKGNYY